LFLDEITRTLIVFRADKYILDHMLEYLYDDVISP
jgi:hypothetical protein